MTKQFGVPLLDEALEKRNPVLLDLAMDLLVPPLSYVGLSVVAVAAGGVGLSLWQGRVALSVYPAAFCVLGLAAYVLRGWWLSGMGARGLVDLMRAPFYVVWKVWLMVAGPRDKKGEWVRTTREVRKP
jgi:hypothetical protein